MPFPMDAAGFHTGTLAPDTTAEQAQCSWFIHIVSGGQCALELDRLS